MTFDSLTFARSRCGSVRCRFSLTHGAMLRNIPLARRKERLGRG